VRELRAIKRGVRGKNPVEDLLRKKCDEFITVVRMLAARGTRKFYENAVKLYGEPRQKFADSGVDNLSIARLWAQRPPARDEERTLDSHHAIERIRAIVAPHLGGHVQVKESARIVANAAAGATSVAVKKGARFTHKQVEALAHHEGLWHVLTSLNGYHQPTLTVLGVGLPRFTMAQEGGGIVSEYLARSVTDDRFRELGERTIAVDLAIQGADYLQVFSYLRERGFQEEKAAQMCERVFRGGVIRGGAPFTKDAVYGRGYCRMFNFIRHAVNHNDPQLLRAFCAGKMAHDDAALVKHLIDEGVCVGPRFLPPWLKDLDTIYAIVTHSVTMMKFDLTRVAQFYERQSKKYRPPAGGWLQEVAAGAPVAAAAPGPVAPEAAEAVAAVAAANGEEP
jgi:uncharacterized protein (TIGR02421 family)